MDGKVFVIILTLLSMPILGVIGYFVNKLLKAKIEGGKKMGELEAKVEALLAENQSLQDRMYNIETIVVDHQELYALPPRNEATELSNQLKKLAEEKNKLTK